MIASVLLAGLTTSRVLKFLTLSRFACIYKKNCSVLPEAGKRLPKLTATGNLRNSKSGFSQTHNIGNNANIGIRDFTT